MVMGSTWPSLRAVASMWDGIDRPTSLGFQFLSKQLLVSESLMILAATLPKQTWLTGKWCLMFNVMFRNGRWPITLILSGTADDQLWTMILICSGPITFFFRDSWWSVLSCSEMTGDFILRNSWWSAVVNDLVTLRNDHFFFSRDSWWSAVVNNLVIFRNDWWYFLQGQLITSCGQWSLYFQEWPMIFFSRDSWW